jgi:hypothetical protein
MELLAKERAIMVKRAPRFTVHTDTLESIDNLLPESGMKDELLDTKLKYLVEHMNTIVDRIENAPISAQQLFTLFGVTPEEQDMILDIFQKHELNFAREMRIAMVARCKTLAKGFDRLQDRDVNNPTMRKGQIGAAEKRLHEFVTQLMHENDTATQPSERVYFSLEFLKRQTKCGKSQVVAYRRKYASMLQNHHSEHGWHDEILGNRHNRMVSQKYKRLMEDIE